MNCVPGNELPEIRPGPLLLDTHALLWWLDGDHNLSQPARQSIGDAHRVVFVSAASAWEIATKVRIGKLPGAVYVAENFAQILEAHAFQQLPMGVEHARRAGLMPVAHRDPFDRMLIAQAQIEGLILVSNETLFDHFGVQRLW
ncbi:MAG: type II toxin-antitoxin system VapC family toxin [Chromatiaceae bacterium]|nr:type II toxin-antitoxin system VapC family toxin [Chromatiaceae bacterium]MBP6734967.1 type II toxin-antitoxin system VapC family toxin [Chromatiaceae bacterium]MBP6808473.1 type II toxin-antitoxin system VapC family toxin [Chromatiaceae bacterium]MBP8290225.1 type II toxin-antitoxin system VapC family toxin [Chromatiaceae bacterium]